MVETRAMAAKRRRMKYEQEIVPTDQTVAYVGPSITSIPFEITFRIIFFAIITNEDAKTTWPICSSWMKITDEIVAKMNPQWDFESHYISPMRFRPGFSFLTYPFYQMIRDITFYGTAILNDPDLNGDNDMQVGAVIWVRKPNILEIFDCTRDYRFSFSLECPMTIWNNDQIMEPQSGCFSTGDVITIIQDENSLRDDKSARKMAINYDYLNDKSPIFRVAGYLFDCKVSSKSIGELDNLVSHIISNRQIERESYGRVVCLCTINGVFILGKAYFDGTGEWVPVWNDKGLSMEDMIKIWTEDGKRRKRCYVMTAVVKTWTSHLNLIKPFDFVNLRQVAPSENWGSSFIHSSVVKDGISACFKF